MIKKKIIIGGSVAVVMAVAAVTPYFVGVRAEKRMRADHELIAREIAFPGLKITLDGYQRGYLSAEAVTAIIYTPEAKDAKPIRLEFHHHISHLPNLSHFAIASATSELVLPAEIAAQASKLLNGQPPITVKSYIRLNGSQLAIISSPAFKTTLDDKSTTVEWKGIEGRVTQSRNSDSITNDIKIPGIIVSATEGGFSMSDLHYQSSMKRGSYDLWFGTSDASLKSLQFNSKQVNETRNIAVNDLQLNSEQKEEGPVTHGNVALQFGKSNFDEVALDSCAYDFEYRNFDTKTLSDIQTTMQRAYTRDDAAMLGAAILSSVPDLLKAKPEINIRRFEVKSSLGNFSGKFHLAFAGEWKDEMMSNPMMVLPMLDADIDITVTKSLLLSLGRSQMRSSAAAMAELQGDELSDEEIDAMATEQASQRLEILTANEYLMDKGDLYTTKIHFEKGQFTINGKIANDIFGPPSH